MTCYGASFRYGFSFPTVHAAPVGLLRKAVSEIVEGVLKKGGATAARELAEFGGEQAVREITEQTWRAGGETAVRRLTHYATAHGAAALRAVRTHPVQVLRALDQVPASQASRALAAINHNSATIVTQAVLIMAFLVGLGLYFRIIRLLIQDWRAARQQRRAEVARIAVEARNKNTDLGLIKME